MDATQVIIRPVVSEKSFQLADLAHRYTFRVHPDAHKTHIRQAVESLFDVHVIEVRTMSVKGKPKRRGTTPRGSTRRWKKAIVQIRPDESIPVFGGLTALEE
jgi:large subunit ribosomal protein L23